MRLNLNMPLLRIPQLPVPIGILAIVLCFNLVKLPAVSMQRTNLDIAFQHLYRPIRLLGLNVVGRSGDNKENVQRLHDMGKTQRFAMRARSVLKFCDAENGPGRRSATRPTSVHRLRPGDIDIVGGLGDSLTAGNGIFATNVLHTTVENRGASFTIGGEANWRKYLTLPNILKEFNPNLYGYSIKDGLSTDRTSKFNVAELGAMSRDIPHEARILVKRLQRDPKVNMTEDWKLVTLFIGCNDFCSDICYRPSLAETLEAHERDMIKTLRYLRDNVPRLFVNYLPAPNLHLLRRLKGLPAHCHTTLLFECPCLIGNKPKSQLDYYDKIIKTWIERDYEIVNRNEFNTDTFTVNVQDFMQIQDFPQKSDGNADLTMLSEDCFHLSQKGQALCANALWNNMLERTGNKSVLNSILFDNFRCPTEEQPYLATRTNSRADFRN